MLKINSTFKRCLAGVGVAVMLFANTAIGVYAEGSEYYGETGSGTVEEPAELELKEAFQKSTTGDKTIAELKKTGILADGSVPDAKIPVSYKSHKITADSATYYVTESQYNSYLNRAKSVSAMYDAAGNGNDELAKAKGEVRAMTDNMNVKSDVATGAMVLSGLQPFIETVLGIAVYVLTAGMTVFTVADLCYIFIPTLREKMGEVAQNGGKMSTTSKETGETKFRFVTDEALYAVQTCTLESGKHPASVWIKKRIWAYILLGVCLFILLTGNITLIVNIVINVVGGIVNALQSFGA